MAQNTIIMMYILAFKKLENLQDTLWLGILRTALIRGSVVKLVLRHYLNLKFIYSYNYVTDLTS